VKRVRGSSSPSLIALTAARHYAGARESGSFQRSRRHTWQLRHPGSGPPPSLLGRALPPFQMTVRDTLDMDTLGYDYAVTTAATEGTR
jgi:hypothetical protein